MGSPVDLTLGRSSSDSKAVPGSNNEHHNDYQREAAQENLRKLKDERRKVEGFKRELPMCIQLLDDAIKAAEEKLVHGKDVVQPTALRLSCSLEKENGGILSLESRQPMLEEFMPLTRRERGYKPSDTSSDGEGAEDYSGTKSKQPPWMAKARHWNQTTSRSTEFVASEMTRDGGHLEQEQSSVTSSENQRSTGTGAFLRFQQPNDAMPVVSRPKARSGGFCADLNLCVQGDRPTTTLRAASDVAAGSTEVAAAAGASDAQMLDAGNNFSTGGGGGGGNSSRKARRCWSPELHRRFVSALNQLGGSHIATPKQLRELMKVDGLTNDEVKSHLQKYRLHTRRPSSSPSPQKSPAGAPAASPQLVVVGGIWMPPQHAASPAANSQLGSHAGGSDPSQFCHSTSRPLDYFAACIKNGTPAGAGQAPMQMLQLHQQPIFASPQPAGASQSQTSPQGPLQVTSQLSGVTQGSSSETYESGEEEAKSQSTSWNVCRQREGNQSTTVESSQSGEPAEPKKLNSTVQHEHGNEVQPPLAQPSG